MSEVYLYPETLPEKLGLDVVRERMLFHALSPLGEHYLEMLAPVWDRAVVEDRLTAVSEMMDALRYDDPLPFEHLHDIRELLHRAVPADAWLSGAELLQIRQTLQTGRYLKRYMEHRREKYPALAARVAHWPVLPSLEQHMDQVLEETGQIRDSASDTLRQLRKELRRLRDRLREVIQEELQWALAQGYAADGRPTLRNGRMVIPIRAEAKRKVQGFIHDTSASGQTVYVEPARALALNNEVREVEVRIRREEERLLRELTRHVRAHLEEIRMLLSGLGMFDGLQAMARLGIELAAEVPRLNDAGVVRLRSARNPVLLLHFRLQAEREGGMPREVVPLDLELGADFRTLIITGPNAGGKTVAMKTVGLLCLMTALGLPIPAHPTSEIPLFRQVLVDIGDEQSEEADLSTFSAHMTRLRHMVERSDEHTLNLIDEAGTGTDPSEGAALAQAVLEALTRQGARTVATTHHGALKVFAFETEGVENGSMQFDAETLQPTYRFIPGVPGSSYAFEIARRIGLPASILERARQLVGTEKTALESLIRYLEAQSQALERQLEEARKAQAEAEEARARYLRMKEELEARREALLEEALEEARRLLAEANARIERTIREIREAEAAREATRKARQQLEAFRTRLEARKPHRRGGKGPPVAEPVQVGDRVVIDEGTAVAEVLAIEDDEAVLALGPMRTRVPLRRLRKVGGPRPQQVHVRTTTDTLPSLEVSPRLDVRGQRVQEALQAVEQYLDRAVAAGLDRVEIVHGKGTGALRTAIQDYLRQRPEVVSFEEALPHEGGAGVTVVTLKT